MGVDSRAYIEGGSAIDFLAMADLHDIDEKCTIVDAVNDPVPPLAYAVSVTFAREFLATAWSGLVRERRDLSSDPLSFPLGYNGLELLDRGCPDFDAISRHVASTA
jgi:hypothetical protein